MSCVLCGKDQVYSRNLCRTDYVRERRHGNLDNFPKTKGPSTEKCIVDDCDEYQKAKKMRLTHYYAHKAKEFRMQIITAYGHKCTCCGITQYEFLTIDHVNNDGAEERKAINGANIANRKIYQKIIDDGYPDRYQILCWNCNAAKQYHGGCPSH